MSTRGFIGMKRKGETRLTYNHSDSYPSWLGLKMLEYVRDENVEADGEAFFQLPLVEEGEAPNEEQAADLKARGLWQNVSSGMDWYAHLRNAQGDLQEYIKAGYLPTVDNTVITSHDIFMEWGYVVDLDAKELVVYQCDWDGKSAMLVRDRISFDEIRDEDADLNARVAMLEAQDA